MDTHKGRPRSAFTLIELLIVVAIIAILAAIAVPNFLEAQVRAKVTRAMADMRTMAIGLESYAVDWNRSPLSGTEWRSALCVPGAPNIGGDEALNALTTPIAYISGVLKDPFVAVVGAVNGAGNPLANRHTFIYLSMYQCVGAIARYRNAYARGYTWSIHSFGPTRITGGNTWTPNTLMGITNPNPNITDAAYDSTNGTVSRGFIIRTNKGHFTGTPGS